MSSPATQESEPPFFGWENLVASPEFPRLPKVDSFNQNLGSKCKREVMLVTWHGLM